jgi:hypothetical protein
MWKAINTDTRKEDDDIQIVGKPLLSPYQRRNFTKFRVSKSDPKETKRHKKNNKHRTDLSTAGLVVTTTTDTVSSSSIQTRGGVFGLPAKFLRDLFPGRHTINGLINITSPRVCLTMDEKMSNVFQSLIVSIRDGKLDPSDMEVVFQNIVHILKSCAIILHDLHRHGVVHGCVNSNSFLASPKSVGNGKPEIRLGNFESTNFGGAHPLSSCFWLRSAPEASSQDGFTRIQMTNATDVFGFGTLVIQAIECLHLFHIFTECKKLDIIQSLMNYPYFFSSFSETFRMETISKVTMKKDDPSVIMLNKEIVKTCQNLLLSYPYFIFRQLQERYTLENGHELPLPTSTRWITAQALDMESLLEQIILNEKDWSVMQSKYSWMDSRSQFLSQMKQTIEHYEQSTVFEFVTNLIYRFPFAIHSTHLENLFRGLDDELVEEIPKFLIDKKTCLKIKFGKRLTHLLKQDMKVFWTLTSDVQYLVFIHRIHPESIDMKVAKSEFDMLDKLYVRLGLSIFGFAETCRNPEIIRHLSKYPIMNTAIPLMLELLGNPKIQKSHEDNYFSWLFKVLDKEDKHYLKIYLESLNKKATQSLNADKSTDEVWIKILRQRHQRQKKLKERKFNLFSYLDSKYGRNQREKITQEIGDKEKFQNLERIAKACFQFIPNLRPSMQDIVHHLHLHCTSFYDEEDFSESREMEGFGLDTVNDHGGYFQTRMKPKTSYHFEDLSTSADLEDENEKRDLNDQILKEVKLGVHPLDFDICHFHLVFTKSLLDHVYTNDSIEDPMRQYSDVNKTTRSIMVGSHIAKAGLAIYVSCLLKPKTLPTFDQLQQVSSESTYWSCCMTAFKKSASLEDEILQKVTNDLKETLVSSEKWSQVEKEMLSSGFELLPYEHLPNKLRDEVNEKIQRGVVSWDTKSDKRIRDYIRDQRLMKFVFVFVLVLIGLMICMLIGGVIAFAILR